jgi:ribosomal protein S18 acetylase RimI-like enzyme
MRYRLACSDDAAALATFAAEKFIEAYRDQCPLQDLTAYAATNFATEQLREEISSEFSRIVLAEQAGALAGYALLRLESAPDCGLAATRPAQVERIYVDPEWQGRGVARELLGRCVAEARAAGCDVVWLAVWDANGRAIRFYLKSGFQIVGEQPFLLGADVQRDFVMAWPDWRAGK